MHVTSSTEAKKTSWLCGDAFGKIQPHHAGIAAVWEHEWKRKCSLNIYPFHWCRVSDMQAIIDELIAKGIDDAYDDRWTETFLPHLLRFEADAQDAEAAGDASVAQDLYLRGASLGMISRFPMIDSPVKRRAWAIQKRLYLCGTSFWECPAHNIYLSHTHAANGDGPTLQVIVRRPSLAAKGLANPGKLPVFVVCTGLDGYRIDNPPAIGDMALGMGFVVVYMDIPGTGDAPGAPNDPEADDRQLATLLDWIHDTEGLDESRVLLLGTSTGGYSAMRAAHVHRDRIGFVVAQGGASDLSFSREWLDHADGGEYSFSLTKALSIKLGYGYDGIEKMKDEARDRFSLARTGILDQPSTRLLLINGIHDTIFPVEDTILATYYGGPKQLRLMPHRAHMGEPEATGVLKQAMIDFLAQ